MENRSSNQYPVRIIFQLILTLSLFSLWAGFALMVVNPYFHKDLPGYVIGRICIWEFVALLVAAVIAWLLIRKWGNIRLEKYGDKNALMIPTPFGIYFSVYFFVAVLVGIWQFYLFSQQF